MVVKFVCFGRFSNSYQFWFHFLFLVCSVELRELEAKLKAGYMNMERAAQIAEKDALKEKEKVSVASVFLFHRVHVQLFVHNYSVCLM